MIHLRPATPADAGPLALLIADSAQATLAPHYSEVQMAAFLDYYSPSAMQGKIANQAVFCAEMGAQLVGTVALTADAYVVGFYTHADHLGKGIGKAMMRHIELVAQQMGHPEIRLTASPVGLGFYYKLGWEKLSDYIFQHRGVDFDETLMGKRLG
jgi:GNAT superfamily N-acetyltransferase